MRTVIHARTLLSVVAAFVLAAAESQAQTPKDSAEPVTQGSPPVSAVSAEPKSAKPEGSSQATTVPPVKSTQAPNVAATASSTPSNVASPPQPLDSSGDEGASVGEIVVTGSRVIKNGNSSPTPVTVVGVQDMEDIHPTGQIADQLNDLPQFSGSRGQLTNPSGGSQGTSSAATNPAANVLNLRNMGYTRTLVLFDGHRLSPTAPDGTVDTNMIPQMLLQRVDVVTGGASAVYGSDAVTGVVNFVTDTHFNGVKVQANTGLSYYGDEFTKAGGIAFGKDLFGGRGHVEFSFQTSEDPGIRYRTDRSYIGDRWTFENPTTGTYGPYVAAPYVTNSRSTFGGLILGGPLGGQMFTSPGVLAPFVNGTQLGALNQSGGSGAYNDSTLKASLDLDQLFGRLDYDFADNVHGFVDLIGAYNHNWQQGLANTLSTPNGTSNSAITLSSSNPYLPPAIASALQAAGPTFQYSRTFDDDLPATNVDTWERQIQATAGVNVKFGGGYEWDTFFTHARTEQITKQNANINTLNLTAALNSTVNPATGKIVCAVSLTANAGLYPGCVPFNPFGQGAESQAAINYAVQATWFNASTSMDDFGTSLTGAPLSTWAGPINMALSGELRRLSYELAQVGAPNDANNLISCTGLPAYDCKVNASGQVYETATSADRTEVSQSVGEIAYEFDAPILKDILFAKDLSLNAASRYTDYDTSGPAWTWKLGLVWAVNDELLIRATRSKDIRAPTLNDLFLAPSTSTYSGFDLVTHVNSINPAIPFIARGNPALVPEVGKTTTLGFVYSPKWAPGFNFAVDAFKIDVTNAIQLFRGASDFVQTGCAESGGTSAFCQLVVRPINCCSSAVANTATVLYTESLNLAEQWTEGMDFEANYANTVFDRPYSLRLLSTFQPHIVYDTPGSPQFDMAGVGFANGALQAAPTWRASLLARYSPVHNFTIDAMERWRSPLAWGPKFAAQEALQFVPPTKDISSTYYTDLTLSYLFESQGGAKTQVYLSATNVFNKLPPTAAFYGNNLPGYFGGFAGGDDPTGAYYTVGFRFQY
jgi:iron complex outermembrane receptor protein